MKGEPKIAIVILNYNRFGITVDCLNSLREMDYSNYKVILVDNGSANSEGQRLREKFPEIHLIQNETNKGFAAGSNDGINLALVNSFEYVVALNNDCLVEKDWLTKLVNGLKAAGADFGSARIMCYPEKELIYSDGDSLLPYGRGAIINHSKEYNGSGETRQIFSPCGAGAIYSRECLETIRIKGNQFFDEIFFCFFEDIDLAIRLNIKAYKGVCVGDSVIYHLGGKTYGFFSDFHIFLLEKNGILCRFFNFPFILIVLGEFLSCLRITIGSFLYGVFKSIFRKMDPKPPIFQVLKMMIKARIWVIQHFHEIREDRRERKEKGFISWRIFKHFYWR